MRRHPRRWLVTGVAGFIGSALLEELLALGQTVVGVDDFSTGKQRNLDEVIGAAGAEARGRFNFIEGDVAERGVADSAMAGVDVVLHQAALGSVPRSIASPLATNDANVSGFLSVLDAARHHGVGRFVYAASSSTYGDSPRLPKVEEVIGRPLSPYAVSKYVNELYADVFSRVYGMNVVGLRYFNVFGRRQDPEGAYAAVIPRWTLQLMRGEPCVINGDGESSRDFCYIDNVVQANVLAATNEELSGSTVFNVACNRRTSLRSLHEMLAVEVGRLYPPARGAEPVFTDFREGDVRHSQADISLISRTLGYRPSHHVHEGLKESVPWYWEQLQRIGAPA